MHLVYFHRLHPSTKISLRACSVIWNWSLGLISSRITSLIYIDFDELK
jgi:hypothetical protein